MIAFVLAKTILFLFFALPVAVYDSRHFRIPLWCVLAGSLSLLAFFLFHPFLSGGITFASLKNPLLAAASALVLYVLARLLTGGALGWGDVFFGMFAALYNGFPLVFFAIAFAALSGMLYYLALAVRDAHRSKQRVIFRPIFAIPYAPFITFGALLAEVLFRFFF